MLPEATERRTVASSDDVDVVLHHVASGPSGAPLLVAHATGFHGRAYAPMAAALGGGLDAWALDARGHGATAAPASWVVDWRRYGDDAEAAARWVAAHAGVADGALVGFGHSMGGATLLMAAHRNQSLFKALVLYEPIVFPPPGHDFDPDDNPLAMGARRRRRQFASYEQAIAHYAAKPPLGRFTPEALDEYVRGGFAPVDPHHPAGPVELTCTPELESATFAMSHDVDVWSSLPDIETLVLVVGGNPATNNPPSLLAEPIAEHLPNGRYQPAVDLDHFGPFVDPAHVASIVRSMA